MGKTTMVEFVNGQRQRNRVHEFVSIPSRSRFRRKLRARYAPTIALLRRYIYFGDRVFLPFVDSPRFSTRENRIYREKMRVVITVPINLPSRPLISASKLERAFLLQ